MELLRRIGRHDVLIETSESCGIWLEEATVANAHGHGVDALEKPDILGLLSSGDVYLPLSLHWELLDRCNFACPFCYIVGHSHQKIVRFAQIESELSELIDEGLLFCTLTGGEVTIHPDFAEIYTVLKERGVIVDVFTNGHVITDDMIALFQRLPPRTVEVSIYSLNNARLRSVYRAPGSDGASTVLENVLRLRRAGIEVVCKTFLNTVTALDIEDVARWCAAHGILHFSSTDITPAYDGADLSEYGVAKNPRQLPLAAPPVSAKTLPCRTKNYGAAINAAFGIFPCTAIKLADCTFDLRQLGVHESLRRLKAFMRKFQDMEISSMPGSPSSASCMAFAKPIRNIAGELVGFAQPSRGEIPR